MPEGSSFAVALIVLEVSQLLDYGPLQLGKMGFFEPITMESSTSAPFKWFLAQSRACRRFTGMEIAASIVCGKRRATAKLKDQYAIATAVDFEYHDFCLKKGSKPNPINLPFGDGLYHPLKVFRDCILLALSTLCF